MKKTANTTIEMKTRKPDDNSVQIENKMNQQKPINMDNKYTTTNKKITTNKINKNLHDNKNNTPLQRDSPVRITPAVTVKVRGKNVTDLMYLKTFLARKKSERDNRQAKMRRKPVTQLVARQRRVQRTAESQAVKEIKFFFVKF